MARHDLVWEPLSCKGMLELIAFDRLYPAEITPLSIRAPANAISTTGNWIFNFMVVMYVSPELVTLGRVANERIQGHTSCLFSHRLEDLRCICMQ